jgi:hypothetical protein
MRFLSFLAIPVALITAAACSNGVAGSDTGGGGSAGASTTSSAGGGGATSSSSSGGGAGGGKPTCADPEGPQAFEVGSGATCFERLTSGQTVPVMAGPQGGYHIWLGVGCAECGNQAILRYGVKDPATHDWYAGTHENDAVVPLDADGWHQTAGLQAFLPGIAWQMGSELPKGTHVILYAAVLDAGMTIQHEGEVEVVLGDTESWSPPCDSSSNCGTPGGLPCCSDGSFGDAGTQGGGDAG